MNIELKSIWYDEEGSDETHAFHAELSINGVNAGGEKKAYGNNFHPSFTPNGREGKNL